VIRRGFLGALTAALLMRPGRRVAVAPKPFVVVNPSLADAQERYNRIATADMEALADIRAAREIWRLNQ
jgi:hypothetical protein